MEPASKSGGASGRGLGRRGRVWRRFEGAEKNSLTWNTGQENYEDDDCARDMVQLIGNRFEDQRTRPIITRPAA
eukprot:62419-Pleurochrysis_carterae.AAC.2